MLALEMPCSFSRLELDGNAISASGISGLADSVCSGMTTIQGDNDTSAYEDLDDEDYSYAMDSVYEAIEDVTLQLDCNLLGVNGLKAVVRMIGSCNFRPKCLSLEECWLTAHDSELHKIDTEESKRMTLDEMLEDIGQQLCTIVPYSCTITHLYLDRNTLTNKGSHILAGLLCACSRLITLSTCSCDITSTDLTNTLDMVIQFKPPNATGTVLSALSRWHLESNKIDNSGVSFLVDKLQNSSLFSLDLQLHLQGNPASLSSIEALETELKHRQKKVISKE